MLLIDKLTQFLTINYI